jgi:two-component system, cell cycle sensor histidine kinase and response regulator CckA
MNSNSGKIQLTNSYLFLNTFDSSLSESSFGFSRTGKSNAREDQPRYTVLIINDVQDQLDLFSFYLQRTGYKTLTALDGKTGLEMAEIYRPDLIISDVSMPTMDGIEMCRLIRDKAELKTIPILLVSAVRYDSESVVEGLKVGADDYLEVPCDPMLLVAKVAQLTERKKAQEKLSESEERYRSLVENARDIIYCQDLDGNYISVNKVFEQILGYTQEETLKLNQRQIIAPEYYEKARSMVARKLEGEDITTYELEAVRKDGRRVWLEVRNWLVYENEMAVAVQGVSRDITERKHTENQLRRSEERYRLMFESNPQPMWVYDVETLAFLEVNDASIHHYGYSHGEFLSMTIKDISHPEDIPLLMDTLSRTPDPHVAVKIWRHRKRDGAIIYVELRAHSFNFNDRPARLIQATDMTVRRALEGQLHQAQKMEAIGQLAGGVAHDFNNLLTAIIGYSDLAHRILPSNNSARPYLQEIQKAGNRASALTCQLLAFSRKQALQPVVLNLNVVVSEMKEMLHRLIGESIELQTSLDARLGNVRADYGQIEQVIMNLVVNARDAMPRGGKLTIQTQNIDLGKEYIDEHITDEPGFYVMLTVSDTGVGMDEETQKHIFEPFFTTKAPGKGTGLGLSTVYGIVKQSGGDTRVTSEPDRGTTFKVYLPQVGEQSQPLSLPVEVEKDLRGTETVLLVEDEEIVRKLAREALETYGYQVLEVTSAADALLLYRQSYKSIDLLLTDVVMPQRSVLEFAESLSKIHPQLKVLYMSGYSDEAISRHGVLDEKTNFIQKPFTPSALARTVREILDRN